MKTAANMMVFLGLLAMEGGAAWMKTANYNDPVIRQQHFDLGTSYAGTVVHLMWGDRWRGSGVMVHNSRCVLLSAHQFEDAGSFQDPNVQELYIRSGPNHLNDPGVSVRISQIIRHPTRTSPGVGTDSVIAILESELPGAIPALIATEQPAVNDVLDMIGSGNQGTASLSAWGYIIPTSGDIIGGRAPVNTIDSATIKTRFAANSTQPLIYNGTPGDSGGGLFNAQRQLCGTLSTVTTPSGVCSTYSVNLVTIAPWIQQATEPYNLPSSEPIPPTLAIQRNGGQIMLTASGAPLAQSGGEFKLETSLDLVDWDPSTVPFTAGTAMIALTEVPGFYRLAWVPDPPAARALRMAPSPAPTPDATPKAMRWIRLPATTYLLLPSDS